MTWSDLTCDWATAYATLQQHFPHLEDAAMPVVKRDKERFASYLAARHALTLAEAQEALDDFLLIQTLWLSKASAPKFA